MYKKIIIITIIALVGLVVIWSEMNAPVKLARPVQNAQPQVADFGNVVDEIGHMILCPDSACAAQGVMVAHSECETSTLFRAQIATMLQNGLTKEGVLAHLRMSGLIPGDPGMPEGHPPMGATMESSGGDSTQTLPPGHPPIPADHPPMGG
jgi:hypothetical protein